MPANARPCCSPPTRCTSSAPIVTDAEFERTLDPAWLRVRLEERPGRVPALLLSTREQHEEVATRLGEHEKRDLSRALRSALHRWRNPVFNHPEEASPC